MRWSLKIAKLWGIGIYLHWTFLILPAWMVVASAAAGQGTMMILRGLALIVAVFACIVMHELGHALTARKFGVQTRDITLLPIGGVARMERIPENPFQEFWIAIAGPAVNAVIALVLGAILFAWGGVDAILAGQNLTAGSFVTNVMWVNVALLVFNLIPAFPMDGGRVLRAILASRLPYVQATKIAATVGQMLAIFLFVIGLLSHHWMLTLVAIFVYIGAHEESQMVQIRALFKGIPVRETMITRFSTLSPDDYVQTAANELLAGYQHDFPIVENGQLVGMLTRQDVLHGLSAGDNFASVSRFMHREFPVVRDTDLLDLVMPQIRQSNCPTMAVLQNGELKGLLTAENISEWVMVQSALHAGLPKWPPPPIRGVMLERPDEVRA